MTDLSTLRHAATVILIRDRADNSYEIFFMRRSRNQSFMGGAYVFPGGALEANDCDASLLECFLPASPKGKGNGDGHYFSERLQDPGLEASVAGGLHCAAIRETFEEAGVLLAVDSSGRCPDFSDPEIQKRFSGYRQTLHGGEMTLKTLLVTERLHLAHELLLPHAHWITPDIESKRFNTRFFLARLPEGQIPIHDEAELTASAWMTPAAALAANASGQIKLMPPTLKTVHELQGFQTSEAVFLSAAERKLLPMLPQFFKTEEGGVGLKLPFDPDYSLPDFKLPTRTGEPSRLYNRNGIWTI